MVSVGNRQPVKSKTSRPMRYLVATTLVVFAAAVAVEGLELSPPPSSSSSNHHHRHHRDLPPTRRGFFRKAGAAAVGAVLGTATAATTTTPAGAACLPGDLSKDCIGVYKLPYLDATESSWLYDRDQLREFAPDIRYIEVQKQPDTVAGAKSILRGERTKIKFIREVVLDGDLERAGILILNLIPTVTSAGLKLQDYVERNTPVTPGENSAAEKELRRFQNSFEVLVAEWSSIDIELGFALRGQRGVTAVAQIEVLRYLKDATVALDDFIRLADQNTGNKPV